MLIWIGLGGAAGSVLRYLIGSLVQKGTGAAFPLGTLVVNAAGCFIIGALTQHFMNLEPSPASRAALVTGFCGGFTTFSAFSIETVGLMNGGEYTKAAAYVLLSASLAIGATFAGIAVIRASA